MTDTLPGRLVIPLSAREMFLTGVFAFCLYPIVIGAISVNYTFLLFPVCAALFTRRLHTPTGLLLFTMLSYTLIFALATVLQPQFSDLFERRLTSFILFLTIFSFAFMRVDETLVRAFKAGIVLLSLILSLMAIAVFLLADRGGSLGYEAKDLVGSQRTGFIYILGFWLIFLAPRDSLPGYIRNPVLLALLTGLFLTFSRSSIVALVASLSLYWIHGNWSWLVRPNARRLLNATGIVIVGVLAIWVLTELFPILFVFYEDRLLSLLDPEILATKLDDAGGSEGQRVVILKLILDYVLNNPVTGSGFLGVWAIPDAHNGSAHNQYLDVLLRTGFAGLIMYLLILFSVLQSLYRAERGLFWGLTGVLVYGMVHETFSSPTQPIPVRLRNSTFVSSRPCKKSIRPWVTAVTNAVFLSRLRQLRLGRRS